MVISQQKKKIFISSYCLLVKRYLSHILLYHRILTGQSYEHRSQEVIVKSGGLFIGGLNLGPCDIQTHEKL